MNEPCAKCGHTNFEHWEDDGAQGCQKCDCIEYVNATEIVKERDALREELALIKSRIDAFVAQEQKSADGWDFSDGARAVCAKHMRDFIRTGEES